MYVTISGSGKSRVIQFRHDSRIPGTNKRKVHVVETIGNYEKLLEQNPNIIEELKAEAKRRTAEAKLHNAPISIEVPTLDIYDESAVTSSYHFGHSVILNLWKKLGLDKVFSDNLGKRDYEKVFEALFCLLSQRCSNPSSIRASNIKSNSYAGFKDIKLDTMYDVLDILSQSKDKVVERLAAFFEKNTDRSLRNAYYDVTTLAFESTRWGELRMFGFSKDHKNNEVQVVMGLLIDNNGIPVTYELFPGNTMDQKTLIKAVERLQTLYNMEKITVVADRGLNSGTNLEFLCSKGHDFVISYTLKRSKEEFKRLALDPEGWTYTWDKETGELITKEKVVEQVMEIKVPISGNEDKASDESKKRGRPKKYEQKQIPVKVHLTWSVSRAEKDYSDRFRMLEKLSRKLDKPYQLKASVKRGLNQYLEMDLDTSDWKLDEAKIMESSKFDGYYAVVTNNLELTTKEVYRIYRGLWKIEESFRVLKTDLKARPVFVWNEEHIKGHFVLCYISLCILRYMQLLLRNENNETPSCKTIMESLENAQVVIQGTYPNVAVTPIKVNNTYINLMKALNMPVLKKNMTITKFRSTTKLDLNINLK